MRGKVAIDGKDIGDAGGGRDRPFAGARRRHQGHADARRERWARRRRPARSSCHQLTATQNSPQCAEPKRRTLTDPHAGAQGGLARASASRASRSPPTLGGGTVTAQLTATLDRGVHVQLADLDIKALPLEKVLVDYLCQGYAITGPLDLTGALTLRDPRRAQHA